MSDIIELTERLKYINNTDLNTDIRGVISELIKILQCIYTGRYIDAYTHLNAIKFVSFIEEVELRKLFSHELSDNQIQAIEVLFFRDKYLRLTKTEMLSFLRLFRRNHCD